MHQNDDVKQLIEELKQQREEIGNLKRENEQIKTRFFSMGKRKENLVHSEKEIKQRLKKRGLMAGVFAVLLIVTGTFAWSEYNQ